MNAAALIAYAWAAKVTGLLPFALLHAAKNRHLHITEGLLAASASPYDLQLALHLAAADDHARAIGVLLGNGADPNARYPAGGTIALHDAARTGAITAIEVLLSAGANVNAADEDGATPLHWAARNDQAGVIRALVAAGADTLARNSQGNIPLWYATKGRAAAAVLQSTTSEAVPGVLEGLSRSAVSIEKGKTEGSALPSHDTAA